ncbi:cupin domain-containing protein [Actinomadura napierensis]|uniref:Homogentisate 1,2-dioxygenase n=1 Tax=Actinomadura napierensis TaxID=267854 RepID=A0ABN2YPN6_9ACTN
MATVQEVVQVVCTDQPERTIERDEDQLLAAPHPNPFPIKLWRDHEPLTVVHMPQEYRAQPFAPPRGIYENDQVRIEWQTMDNRQPFYHRNCDVDEISYQIAGDRTLMTELGVVEHRPGEFSRLPRGVAHDNHGREESHLLFYTPAPAREERAAARLSEPTFPAFPGWEPGAVNEAVTQCLGTPGHDITVFPIDELRLLEQVYAEDGRLQVLRGTDDGVNWLYRSPCFRLATVRLPAVGGHVYRRTLDADEIQYQISGHRTLVSQRGIVDLGPGDFVRIPLGVAHTSISTADTEYIAVYSDRELPQIAATSKTAEPYTPRLLAARRG